METAEQTQPYQNDKLTKALKLFLKKENKQAWDICKELLEESYVSTDELAELTFMSTINLIDKFKSNINRNELNSTIGNYINSSEKKNIYGYAEIILAGINKANYAQKLDNVIANYSSSIKELAMFKKLVYFYHEEGNLEKAKSIYNTMLKTYSESSLTREAAYIINENKSGFEKEAGAVNQQQNTEYYLQNFPNPFN